MANVQTIVTKVRCGGNFIELMAYAEDHITNCLLRGNLYEEALLEQILQSYGTGGVYVDFGAFIGSHSLFFAIACKADLVIAAEPNPISYAMLDWNIKHNNVPVEAFACGVGDTSKRMGLWIDTEHNNNGGTQLVEGDIVPVLPAGALITTRPKLIKIDVEGFAMEVLRGCTDILQKHSPVLVVEECCGLGDEIRIFLKSMSYQEAWRYKGGGPDTTIYERSG